MIKKVLIIVLWSTQCFAFIADPRSAAQQQSNVNANDAYFNNRKINTSTTGVDTYSAAHPQNTSGAASAGSDMGSAARSQYSNPSTTSSQLNKTSSGTGGMLDLAGVEVNNTKTTKYDVCVFNLPSPKNVSLCATDKITADAYKACKAANPNSWQTACASMAGALADVNFQAGCSNVKQWIKLSYIFSPSTGDIDTLYITADPTLQGTASQTVISPLPSGKVASGVCANGIISCNPGSWGAAGTPCEYYKWDSAAGIPSLVQTTNMSEIGGCYCVNKSCGNNLAALNGGQILRDFAGGVSGAILKTSGEGVQVSDTKVETGNLTITLNGSLLSDCQSNVPGGAPKVAANSSGVTNLTGIAQSMTNANPTVDTLEDAGIAASASQEAEADDQGAALSADAFSDASTRATWKSNYLQHGNNLVKLVKGVDDISGATFQEVNCTIKRNYGIASPQTIKSDSNPAVGLSTDNDASIAINEVSPNSYNLWWYTSCGKKGCGNPGSLATWTIPVATTGVTVATSSSTNTGTASAGLNATNLLNTSTTTTTTTTSILGSATSYIAHAGGDCSGSATLDSTITSLGKQQATSSKCGNYGVQSWTGFWDYTMTFTQDIASEGIADGCQALANNPDCNSGANNGIVHKKVDGVNVVTNYMSTGLNPLPSCKQFAGVTGSYTVCRPWWEERRTYQCTNTTPPNTDVQAVSDRGSSVNNSMNNTTAFNEATGDMTYSDTATDVNGNMVTTSQSAKLSISSPNIKCDMVCKVSKIQTDTQSRTLYGSTIDTTAPTTPQRSGVGVMASTGAPANAGAAGTQAAAVKVYDTKYCKMNNAQNITSNASDWKCVVAPDETIEVDCSCPENMGESIGRVSALLAAGKDQKCTTGATTKMP